MDRNHRNLLKTLINEYDDGTIDLVLEYTEYDIDLLGTRKKRKYFIYTIYQSHYVGIAY